MNLGACPHCGCEGGVFQSARVTGGAQQVWSQNGKRRHIDYYRLRFLPHSDAVRCRTCHRIRRDWMVVDGELVRQGE